MSCDSGADCDDRCGAGTQCVGGKCIVAEAEDVSTAEADTPEDTDGKGKRRRRRRRKADGADAPAGEVPSFDDSRVPKFDPNRNESIGESAGSERIADRTIRQHLSKFEPRLNRCIAQLAEAGVDVGSGQVGFDIGIESSGRVWGVTAQAPAAMKQSGLVACMRLAISRYRFPSWDGPALGVEYSFEVG
jgi:hypothetical protein